MITRIKKWLLLRRYKRACKIAHEIRASAIRRGITEDAAIKDWLDHGYSGLPH